MTTSSLRQSAWGAAVVVALLSASRASAAEPARPLPEPTAHELREIEELAVRGQQEPAIEGYRSLLARGVDFPALRYNLGTLYLERGDVGRAVLHLKTALRADPHLDDARYNLERALAGRADELEGTPRAPSLMSSLASGVSSSEASLRFAAALVVFALLFGLWPWTPPRSLPRRCASAALLLAVAAVALTALMLAARVRADEVKEAVILERELSARAAPSRDAAAAFVAHAGLHGVVVDEEAGFFRLRLENGLDAWFPRAALGVVGEPRAP